MKMKMRATGVKELEARFRYAAEKVPDNARKLMHRRSDKIVKMAKLFAPVDDHELEDSIRKEVTYSSKGRLQISVVAGGIVRGVDVSRYVAIIHENYESFKPGKNTIAKRAANPGIYVGSKFIKRAVDAERKSLREAMINVTVRTIKGEPVGENQ
jgi:hypothetical protein